MRNAQRYLLTGILSVIPLWITWLVFKFFFVQLSSLGRPWAMAVSKALQQHSPTMAEWMVAPLFQSILAILLTLLALYLLGWVASKVIGQRILSLLDNLMHRIP
ncbi:MAG: DUF502 domain-containing protein, partial [Halobacteria archaeon]|nr:DUF502 domain-containing protein [Halobacteria archaeon]